MANEEQVKILKQGHKVWNRWRDENSEVEIDLSDADLKMDDLRWANLRGADLSGANLEWANLTWADLDGTNFDEAIVGHTDFANVDMSGVKGIETVYHKGYSQIGFRTLVRTKGQIPVEFLRGCGVPEPFIENLTALLGAIQSIHFYSCFISYSSRDEKFAKRLYRDLQWEGVRCWFAPEHLPIGAKIRHSIDQSIYFHDKLLLILSCHSLSSQWIEQEVETALERERTEHRLILFPIRLDEEVMKIKTGWPLYLRNTRNIGDFTNQGTYHQSFQRLLRDLREEK